MPSLVFPLPRLRSRLRAPVRQFAFWSPPAPPPYTEFPLVSPVATEHPYTAQSVPQHIARPQYADTGRVDQASIPKSPVIWSEYEISKVNKFILYSSQLRFLADQRLLPVGAVSFGKLKVDS